MWQRLLLAVAATTLAAGAAGEDCSVLTVSPSAGPLAGGTLVNLTGIALGAGSAWRCAFGAPDGAGAMVGAEYFSDGERVGCYAPARELAGSLAVNVSIDGGSSWCGGAALPYAYYAPLNVSAVSPASGSVQGGTVKDPYQTYICN